MHSIPIKDHPEIVHECIPGSTGRALFQECSGLYVDVDGIVPDMLQSSAAMMDSSWMPKCAKMVKIQSWISS